MKKLLLLAAVLTLPFWLVAADSPRQSLNFNRDWKFQIGDHPGADAPAFDDSAWSAVGLPHSFSMPYFESPRFYTGYGWYRKHFTVPADWTGKRISLEFDGAFQVAEVSLNGRPVGVHRGGYTGFTLDITAAVTPGDNVVAIRVNNLWDAQLAPRAGEHVFSGGIYRDVRLVLTDPLHVTWYGTFVTTPKVSAQAATVDVQTELRNDGADSKTCVLQTDLLDPDGRTVATLTSTQTLAAGATVNVTQTSDPLPNPKLWHPDHPFLYTAQTRVQDGDLLADTYATTFGIRWFQWTPEQGFFLNGSHFYFEGVDVHQDHAGWGDAVADSGFYRDVKLVKDAGFQFIRGSHYPHNPAFAAACDQLGVLFWSENCFWGMGGRSPDGFWNASAYPVKESDRAAFDASVKDSLRDMIRINRNHPSIVAWSMCNEVFFSDKTTLPRVRTFLKELVDLTHQLDPTRPAGIGGCQRQQLDKIGDVAGYNGDGARLFIDPGIPNLITEYSSVRAIRPGKYGPAWGNLTQGPGNKSQPFFWRYAWRSGEVLWCAFDHGSIAGDEGRTGIIDYFRLPKRAWYWYRNEYLHIPPPAWPAGGTAAALRLTADHTTLTGSDGTDDAQIIATVVDASGRALSNSPPVTLTIESGPGEFPTGRTITFDQDSDIAIHDGQAAIEFRTYQSGPTVIRATSPGLRDGTLTITSVGGPDFVPGQTPVVQPRPYVRFDAAAARETRRPAASVFGLNNPSLASSEAPDHPASNANDGTATTNWQPADSDANPWWQVDLERAVTLTRARLTFPAPGNYRYKIETSADDQHWTLVTDQTQTTATDAVRTETFPAGTAGHLLRVTFVGRPAALAELEVTGRLTAQ